MRSTSSDQLGILGACLLWIDAAAAESESCAGRVDLDESTVQTIESQVVAMIAAKFNASEHSVTPHTDLRRDLGADSLALVELVLLLESEFQVDIPDEEAEEITTVQQVINYLSVHEHPGAQRAVRRRRYTQ